MLVTKRKAVKSGPPAAEMLRACAICRNFIEGFLISQHTKRCDLMRNKESISPFPTKLHTMALDGHGDRIAELKKQANESQPVNPFYSPTAESAANDDYKYNAYKVRKIVRSRYRDDDALQPYFPVVSWEPLKEVDVIDRGHLADPEKKALFSAAKKVRHLTPAIGTEITGINLRQLAPAQKDELCVLPTVMLKHRLMAFRQRSPGC